MQPRGHGAAPCYLHLRIPIRGQMQAAILFDFLQESPLILQKDLGNLSTLKCTTRTRYQVPLMPRPRISKYP